MRLFKYLLFLLIFNTFVFSNEKIDLLNKSYIFIDTTQELSFEDIKKKSFFKANEKIKNYGINKKRTIWIKFDLQNNTQKTKNYILEYPNAIVKKITLYKDNQIYKDGSLQINKNRISLRPSFKLSLEAQEKQTYYLEVSSNNSSLVVKLNLWEEDSFKKESKLQDNVSNIFLGAILILLLYNLFLFIFTKEVVYFYYISYIFFISFITVLYTGYASVNLLKQEQITFIVNNQVSLIYLTSFFITLFTKKLLNYERFEKVNKFLNIYLYFLVFIFFINIVFLDNTNNLLVLLLPLFFLLLYKAFKLSFKNKERLAFIYLIGWFPLLLTSFTWIAFSLTTSTVNSLYELLIYLLQAFIVFEAIIFSIALAYRINILQIKKTQADKKLLEEQKNIEINLQKKVNEKTSELQSLLKEKELLMEELNHRVKNNIQMILSLTRLQSRKIKNTENKDFFITLMNRINAIGKLHNILYKEKKINSINPKEYIMSIIEELKVLNDNNILMEYKINCDLNIEHAIYCGLIINELVSNSFKYAFKKEKGSISISLNKINNQYILVIKDNGCGYEIKKDSNSLGLTIVNTLVYDQLEGELKISSKNGTENIITWFEIDEKSKDFNS